MLTIDGVTVRLGGRTILERASATVPVGARVGLIESSDGGSYAATTLLLKASSISRLATLSIVTPTCDHVRLKY